MPDAPSRLDPAAVLAAWPDDDAVRESPELAVEQIHELAHALAAARQDAIDEWNPLVGKAWRAGAAHALRAAEVDGRPAGRLPTPPPAAEPSSALALTPRVQVHPLLVRRAEELDRYAARMIILAPDVREVRCAACTATVHPTPAAGVNAAVPPAMDGHDGAPTYLRPADPSTGSGTHL